MTRKSFLARIVAIIVCEMSIVGGACGASLEPGSGIWSQSDVKPAENSDPAGVAKSPDRKYLIRNSAAGLELFVKDKGSALLDIVATDPLWEVVWPRSTRYFAINASDGGAVGTWETFAFKLAGTGKLVAFPVNKLVLAAAKSVPLCDSPEDPNISTVGWSKDGNTAFVLAEVPPHSSCRNMGEIRGFEVSVKESRIVKQLSEREVRHRWFVLLGCRFRRECA